MRPSRQGWLIAIASGILALAVLSQGCSGTIFALSLAYDNDSSAPLWDDHLDEGGDEFIVLTMWASSWCDWLLEYNIWQAQTMNRLLNRITGQSYAADSNNATAGEEYGNDVGYHYHGWMLE